MRVQFLVLIVPEGQVEQGVHTVALLIFEKLKPSSQVHTSSDVRVQLWVLIVLEGQVCEQGVRTVAPLILEKLEPSTQGMHTLSDVVVQGACS